MSQTIWTKRLRKISVPIIATLALVATSGIQGNLAANAVAEPACATGWTKNIDASYENLVCDWTAITGTEQVFNLSLPEGVTSVYVVAVGGGGGGGGGGGTTPNLKAGGGGGAGEFNTTGQITGLTTTSSITYSVGGGGAGGTVTGTTASDGANGGDTTVKVGLSPTVVVDASGGNGGSAGTGASTGAGGASGSGLLGGSGTGSAGGGGGGTLALPYTYDGITYSGVGTNGSNGTSPNTRKGGNGGEAGYFVAPYSEFPFTGYLIGLINFTSSTYGGAGGVVGGNSSDPGACGSVEEEFRQYGTAGFSGTPGAPGEAGLWFLSAHGSCAYNDEGANGRAYPVSAPGHGGGGGAGSDTTVSLAGLGGAGAGGALWLRYVLDYTEDFAITYSVGAGSGTAPTGTSGATNLPAQGSMVAPTGQEFDGWSCTPLGGTATTYLAFDYVLPTVATSCVAIWTAVSGGGSESTSPNFPPRTPLKSEVKVVPTATSLIVSLEYARSSSSKPTSYTVSVSPGGNSCIIYSTFGDCEIVGLDPDKRYRVSVTATNSKGSSGLYISTVRYSILGNDPLLFVAKTNLIGFEGDSPKLLKKFKKQLRVFIQDNPSITAFTCTGFTAGSPVTRAHVALAKQRAIETCAFIEQIKPEASTTLIGRSPGVSWESKNRKVQILGYSVS